ncbi:MAG: hypothetical protein MJZ56_07160 [Bacteroidales bacterium]|nr:hypothetical protein [Bacteroidales bacterium]
MIKKLLIIVVMVFACGTLHAQEYDPYKEYRYDYEGSSWRGPSTGNEFKSDPSTGSTTPVSPGHGEEDNWTPIGDGIVLLIGLGAAYALRNRKKNE